MDGAPDNLLILFIEMISFVLLLFVTVIENPEIKSNLWEKGFSSAHKLRF